MNLQGYGDTQEEIEEGRGKYSTNCSDFSLSYWQQNQSPCFPFTERVASLNNPGLILDGAITIRSKICMLPAEGCDHIRI